MHTPAAVLESKAFGPWSPPDYQALQDADQAEYVAMRTATSAPGGAGASPAAATLPAPPMAAAAKQQRLEQQKRDGRVEGPPGTPAGAIKSEGDVEHAAAVAAALASPPPTPAQIAVERRVADWLERALLPAINRQVGVAQARQPPAHGVCNPQTDGVIGWLMARLPAHLLALPFTPSQPDTPRNPHPPPLLC